MKLIVSILSAIFLTACVAVPVQDSYYTGYPTVQYGPQVVVPPVTIGIVPPPIYIGPAYRGGYYPSYRGYRHYGPYRGYHGGRRY